MVVNKPYINIPFIDALSQMPSYKCLKEILSNKGKLEELETVALTEECSTTIQNKFPTMFDLSSSISLIPLFMCENLDLGEMRPTFITLELANVL